MNFFVYYPVSEKLLEKHLQFLLKNLEFNGDSGRKAVIEVLTKLVEILPQESLKAHVNEFSISSSVYQSP